MEYNKKKIIECSQVTNVELTLLQIIAEKEKVSGYKINRIVVERGFRNWANIGTTSIYKGLEKLESKKLVKSSLSNKKEGKGPIPRLFSLTEKGFRLLYDTIVFALSNTNERDYRFDLGLAGLGFIKGDDIVLALEDRKLFLQARQSTIKAKLNEDNKFKLPYAAILVFKHPLSIIKNEIQFVESIIKQLKEEM